MRTRARPPAGTACALAMKYATTATPPMAMDAVVTVLLKSPDGRVWTTLIVRATASYRLAQRSAETVSSQRVKHAMMATPPSTTGARLNACSSAATRKTKAATTGSRQLAETASLLAMKYATTVTPTMAMDAAVTVRPKKTAGRVPHQLAGCLIAQRSAETAC